MKTEAVEESLGVSRADIITEGWASEGGLKPGDRFTVAGSMAVNTVPLSFRPLHNQVVIRVLEEPPPTGQFIVAPGTSRRKSTAIGIVIAKGEGHRRRKIAEPGKDPKNRLDGAQYSWMPGYCPLEVKVGDYVLCARNMGEHHYIDGESYLVTPVEHVFAVLEDYEASLRPATEREFGLSSFMDKKWDRPESARPIVQGKNA